MLTKIERGSVVLAGLESSGKTALVRGMSGRRLGDEANYRGATVQCRRVALDGDLDLVDTPGIRLDGDWEAIRLVLDQLESAEVVLLVVRGTHLRDELATLLETLDLRGRRCGVVVTFGDKIARDSEVLVQRYREALDLPVVMVNARRLTSDHRRAVLEVLGEARPVAESLAKKVLPSHAELPPERTLFERPFIGVFASLAAMALMFALPVYVAYRFAEWIQPITESVIIDPAVATLQGLPEPLAAILVGPYGVITLGWYSFLWAFPVVLLIGLSVAVVEETGVKDRITARLDPLLRRIGLSGRDLLPVLTGYGCNVVAVHQSRSCSACTRRACVSLIAFGSACSYQIGASLSIFSASGHPALFAPYLVLLFIAGAIHTRVWHGRLRTAEVVPFHERAFLQPPTPGAIAWRTLGTCKQFLWQAMPIFLLTCVVAAILQTVGLLERVSTLFAGALHWFGLPADVAPGILFSVMRKDGILVLNQDEGAVLDALTPGAIFVTVFLASTLSACLVTLWTIGRELGWKTAGMVAARQALTSLLFGLALGALLT